MPLIENTRYDQWVEKKKTGKYKPLVQATAEEYWEWWLDRDAKAPNPDQIDIFDG